MLQSKLFPAIHLFWKQYQANMLSQLKDLGGITIAGEGGHDSMRHCAKYCAYTASCCMLPPYNPFCTCSGINFKIIQQLKGVQSRHLEFF